MSLPVVARAYRSVGTGSEDVMSVSRRFVAAATAMALILAACASAPSTRSGQATTVPTATTAASAAAAGDPSGRTAGLAFQPVITIDPPETPIDEPVSIHLSGFAPESEVTVRATTVGAAFPDLSDTGSKLTSSATFRTDATGSVAVDTQAPLSGSYMTVDGMGLFWSMTPEPPESGATGAPTVTPPDLVSAVRYGYTVSAEVDGRSVATASVTQTMGSPSVTATDVATSGVLGQFYRPAGAGPFPAVILLAGSQGGLLRRVPKVVAAHGYAVLSLAYIGYTSPIDGSSLPNDTHELPLEYFGKALDWLSAQPGVDPHRIAMMGYSLGGQVALLAATRYPQVKTVVALSAPTFTWDWGEVDSSFSFQGKPIPFANARSIETLAAGFTDAVATGADPLAGVADVVAKVRADPAIAAALIPVERIKGAILLVSGTNDTQGPGPVFGELAMDRLRANQFALPYRHIIGRGAGHIVDFPYAPRSLEVEQGGGTAEANARAATAMWPVVLEYLAGMK